MRHRHGIQVAVPDGPTNVCTADGPRNVPDVEAEIHAITLELAAAQPANSSWTAGYSELRSTVGNCSASHKVDTCGA